MSNCGRYQNVLGKMANTWGSSWQHFGLLAGLHSSLYLPVIFWPKLDYGMGDITTQALLPGQLEFDRRHWYSIGMHGRSIYQVGTDTISTASNT